MDSKERALRREFEKARTRGDVEYMGELTNRDALEMRDYEQEDFEYTPAERLPTVGDALEGEVMGVADKHWNDKYGDFFEKDDEEDRMKVVNIPRYGGPLSTRVDVVPMENNQFQVNGIPNHQQASCVYLKQTFKFAIRDHNGITLVYPRLFRPFTIQRQFQKMLWSAPQCARQFDTHIEQQVKLAPYLCDSQMLKNSMRYKCTPKLFNATAPHRMYYNYTLYEPLLGFQSGYKILGASRPYNQQNMKFPLAIQDYTLTVNKFSTKDGVKRVLRDPFQVTGEHPLGHLAALFAVDVRPSEAVHANAAQTHVNVNILDYKVDEPTLVSFSTNEALQANKNVSSVFLHAPTFEVFSAPVVLKPYDMTITQFMTNVANPTYAQEQAAINLPKFHMLGIDDGTSKTVIKCNTSKGYPSYFLIYLEDFGNDYFDNTFTNSAENLVTGTDMIIGGHPKIVELEMKVFGQSFPITKQLGPDELEYLTKKNCNPKCDFSENMQFDPIVLLKLEDLGLATESVGYPQAKRLELTVEIKQIVLPRHYNLRFIRPGQDAPPMRAYCAFVYENHVLEGNNNRLDFVWK